MFKYRPSPFCLLDEIDAPLDDANIGRFIEMLRSMMDKTQFIIITHSRKTMEIADQALRRDDGGAGCVEAHLHSAELSFDWFQEFTEVPRVQGHFGSWVPNLCTLPFSLEAIEHILGESSRFHETLQ